MNPKMWIEVAGFKEGVEMWYLWEVKGPIQMWFWETFKTRPYCQHAGWHCNKTDCEHDHTARRPREKDYPILPGDTCDYCGEEPATTHTHNPNTDGKPYYWKVCHTCNTILPLQEDLGLAAHMQMMIPTDEGEERIKDLTKRIAVLEKKTGKKAFSTMIIPMEDGKLGSQELKAR